MLVHAGEVLLALHGSFLRGSPCCTHGSGSTAGPARCQGSAALEAGNLAPQTFLSTGTRCSWSTDTCDVCGTADAVEAVGGA